MIRLLTLALLSCYLVQSLSKLTCTGKYKGSFFKYYPDYDNDLIKFYRVKFCSSNYNDANETLDTINSYLSFMQDKEILLPLLKHTNLFVMDENPCDNVKSSNRNILIEKSMLSNMNYVLQTIHSVLFKLHKNLHVECSHDNLRVR